MSDLVFRMASDWKEVEKLRIELVKLKEELATLDKNTPPAAIVALENALAAAQQKLESLIITAAEAGALMEFEFGKAGSALDINSSTDQLNVFDAEVLKMCNNLNKYYAGLLDRLNAMSLLLKMVKSEGDGAFDYAKSSGELEQFCVKNEELLNLIQARKEEILKEQEMWQKLAEAIQTNSVDALKSYLEEMKGLGQEGMLLNAPITTIVDAREQFVQNGSQNDPSGGELGNVHNQVAQVNKEMADMNKSVETLEVLKEGFSGLSSATSVVVGVFDLFNQKSQMLVEIQGKIQAVMGIVTNLESTYTALKKTNVVMLGIENVQRKASVVSQALESKAKTGNIALTWAEIIAQKAFNAVANANPYVLLATAILTVVGGIALLISANKKSTQEQEEQNRRMKIAKELQDEFVKSVASGASSQITSYQKLKQEYTSLGDNMKAKGKFISDNQDAFKDLGLSVKNAADAENVLVRQSDAVVKAIMLRAKAAAAASMAQDDYKKMLERQGQYEMKLKDRKSLKEMAQESAKNQGSDYDNLSPFYQAKWQEAVRGDYDKQEAIIGSYQNSMESLGKAGDSRIRTSMLYSAQAGQTLKEAGIKEEGDNNNTNKANEIRNAEQQLQETRLKNDREFAKKLEDMYYVGEQRRIDALDEGSAKTLEQMELNHKKELRAIDREKKDYLQKKSEAKKEEFDKEEDVKATRDSNYNRKTFDASTVDLSKEEIDRFDQDYKNALDKQRKERQAYDDAEKRALNESLAAYGNYQDKRNAIIALGEDKKKGKSESEKRAIDAETNKKVSDLDIDANKQSSAFGKLFSDKKVQAVKDMREIIEAAQAAVDFVQSGNWDENEGKKHGITKETFDEYRKNPKELQTNIDALKTMTKQADAFDTSFDKVGKGLQKVFSSGSDTEKLQEGLALVKDGINGVISAGKFLSSTLASLGSAFGSEALGKAAEGINVAMDAASAAMSGAEAGKAFGPWGQAAGAAIGLVSSLASSLAKLHDAKHEKKIVQIQENIDELKKTYAKLGDAIEGAYSKDASQMIEQQNVLLEQQKVLIQNQIAEEKSKKNADDGKIEEWQNQLDEIDKSIGKNREKAVDTIFGEDVKTAIDNFAQAYADAWASGEDRAKSSKDFVKNMIKSMIMEAMKMQISGPMQELREKLVEFFKDGKIDKWEEDYINNMAEEMGNKLDEDFAWGDKYIKNDEDSSSSSQESSKKGFAAMSQDSADELNGRFTALQIAGEGIRGLNQQQTEALNLLNVNSAVMLSLTTETRSIADEIRTIQMNSYIELQDIRENTGAIVKPIKEIQKDIAEIKINTQNM